MSSITKTTGAGPRGNIHTIHTVKAADKEIAEGPISVFHTKFLTSAILD